MTAQPRGLISNFGDTLSLTLAVTLNETYLVIAHHGRTLILGLHFRHDPHARLGILRNGVQALG